jgi:Gpi18-like mannosyltransferase
MSAWNHWDAQVYIYIAQHGYSNVRYTAFFPLWPLFEHIADGLFGGGYYRSGLLLANIFFYFALVLLYTLLSEDFDETIARTALFFLAFNAYGLFFFAGFTEALFYS